MLVFSSKLIRFVREGEAKHFNIEWWKNNTVKKRSEKKKKNKEKHGKIRNRRGNLPLRMSQKSELKKMERITSGLTSKKISKDGEGYKYK